MKNDGQRSQGGGPRPAARSNGFFSLRAISSYLRIVSSGASTVASTVRSAGASVASSIVDREDDTGRDQVQWAGFDKLECEGGIVRQVLLLGYRSGFQVWDVEEADDVRELVSKHDASVSFLQMQQKPLLSKRSADKFADDRPLLVVVEDGGGNFLDGQVSPSNGSDNNCNDLGNGNLVPTVVRFYSLRTYSYVQALKFRTAVFSVRCSPRIVAVSQAAQIHCFDAATLEREYTILTYPICLGFGGIGYGPLAVGPRWLAYSGTPVSVSDTGRVSPQHLTSPSLLTPSNGSLVAHYAKESSKQLAAGIVTLGDMGYKKLSRYCSERNISLRAGNTNSKANGVVNGHLLDEENVGTVIIRDIVSKSVVAQFRAHKRPIASLCFDPTGMLLVTVSIQGHNINVFRIMPSPLGSSSGYDVAGSYVHLYRLQRGLTNAVIQDISFSDDSQWIMISSSRGTSHLFAISPSGGTIDLPTNDATIVNGINGLNMTARRAVRWPPTSGSLKPSQQNLCISGPPITLSVVSRIRNGNNGWRGTVSGAAAAATGRASSLSGAIASAFHNCKGGKGVYLDSSSTRTKQHLLVFSPSGCVIQYALRLSVGVESGTNFSGLSTVPRETVSDADVRLVVDPLQKWDVSQRQGRREREDNTDIYGESGSSESAKIFPKGVKRGNSVYPTNGDMVRDIKHSAFEKHHLYISEAELHMHPAVAPLWSKSAISFHVMYTDGIRTDSGDVLGGEIEVERIPTRMIEARSKSLVPVFDHLQTPKFQHSRMSAVDDHRNGPPPYQKSDLPEDGRLSCRSSCSSLDGVSEGATAVAELHNVVSDNGWDGLRMSTESTMGSVNIRDSPMLKTQLDHVNSRDCQVVDAQLKFVNNRESMMMGTHFVDDDNESD
ncbi:hypothetical protein AAC387_Pa06g2186 [Persea americana]